MTDKDFGKVPGELRVSLEMEMEEETDDGDVKNKTFAHPWQGTPVEDINFVLASDILREYEQVLKNVEVRTRQQARKVDEDESEDNIYTDEHVLVSFRPIVSNDYLSELSDKDDYEIEQELENVFIELYNFVSEQTVEDIDELHEVEDVDEYKSESSGDS